MKRRFAGTWAVLCWAALMAVGSVDAADFLTAQSPVELQVSQRNEHSRPRIVSIINFIRQCEPRIEWITEDVLYQTVVQQIESMRQRRRERQLAARTLQRPEGEAAFPRNRPQTVILYL